MTRGMIGRAMAATVLVALGVTGVSTVSSGAPAVKKQRVTIQGSGQSAQYGKWTFTLYALNPGPIPSVVSGKLEPIEDVSTGRRVVNGQTVTLARARYTFVAKHGTLVLLVDERIVSAGTQQVSTATWRVLRGTGVYRGATGKGAGAWSWPGSWAAGAYTLRLEGILTSGGAGARAERSVGDAGTVPIPRSAPES
jgi:hypothetical protein